MRGDQEELLKVRKLRATTIYKLLLVGLLVSFVLLGVVLGIAGYFGADTVKWSNQPIHGWRALLSGPVIAAFVALVFTVFIGTLANFGLWLYSMVRPVHIRIVVADNDTPSTDETP